MLNTKHCVSRKKFYVLYSMLDLTFQTERESERERERSEENDQKKTSDYCDQCHVKLTNADDVFIV